RRPAVTAAFRRRGGRECACCRSDGRRGRLTAAPAVERESGRRPAAPWHASCTGVAVTTTRKETGMLEGFNGSSRPPAHRPHTASLGVLLGVIVATAALLPRIAASQDIDLASLTELDDDRTDITYENLTIDELEDMDVV